MALEFEQVSGRSRLAGASPFGAPLIVAVHGGTYDSQYFDVPGHSLLDRAAALGLPVIAIDRPGYGDTPLLAKADMTLRGQARFLVPALKAIWAQHAEGRPGMVIIGHSIGAAIALIAAGDADDLPLLGIAVSGVGMRTPAEHKPMWEALPDIDLVALPDDVKDGVMFGPPGSFTPEAQQQSHSASRTCPRVELVDIVSSWNAASADVLGRIRCPVHYRQGEKDQLWITGAAEVDDFAGALSAAARVDAAMLYGTGHCLDFHKIGPAFQTQQLGFALQCGAEACYG